MDSSINKVGITGFPESNTGTFGYIIIPSDADRGAYITNCYKTCRVSVRSASGRVINKVLISKKDIQEIDFPDDKIKTGSLVYMTNVPVHNFPVVIGVYNQNDEIPDITQENSFHILRKLKQNFVSISGKAESGDLQIAVCSEETAEVKIQVKSSDDAGLWQVSVQGNAQLDASKSVAINANDSIVLKTKNNKVKKGLSIGKDKAAEPAVLGDTNVKLMKRLITAITKLTVQTSLGPSSVPINVTEFEAIAKELDTILSKIVTLD